MEKYDYKAEYKDLYKPPKDKVSLVAVPAMNFISLEGKGDPNTSIDFKESVEALFKISYTIKFAKKKAAKDPIDYGVMPLEGLWWAEDMEEFSVENKKDWLWRLMIMQPPCVSYEDFQEALVPVKEKTENDKPSQLKFGEFKESTCVQIMHIGPFSEEGPNIQKLHNYAIENGYKLNGKHHEIYLSDIRKVKPENMKTVLRQPVKLKET